MLYQMWQETIYDHQVKNKEPIDTQFILRFTCLLSSYVLICDDRFMLTVVIPRVQNLLIWPSSTRGMGLHTRSTSLTLLSSLCEKGLTWRCYVWNDKSYKLALILLNFQGGTKPANNNHT
jgi:hypothetical protein